MLIRRKDFEDIGGLSEEYFYGFEDVDLCLKLNAKLGKRCVFTPTAQLIHNEGISGKFKQHPKLQNNIEAFRKQCDGKYYNDLEFYINDPNFMIYNK